MAEAMMSGLSKRKIGKGSLPEWEKFIDGLRPIGGRILPLVWDPEDPQLRQDLSLSLLTAIVHAYVGEVHSDPDYPEFVARLGRHLNICAPVPDFTYKGTSLRGDGVYRISGNRGTSLFVDVTMTSNYWAKDGLGGKVAGYDIDDLTIDPDGNFEVLLSNERPEGYEGDWWRLDPRTGWIYLRRASYDWLNEIDARLTIERLDVPARRARRSQQEVAHLMDEAVSWVETASAWCFERVREIREQGLVNALDIQDYGKLGGASQQVYLEGVYDLQPDEALIFESEVPEICRYWSILVTDQLWGTLDWMHRFSSINGHQARICSDGKFRAVISAQDPGTPNWLDIGDYGKGIIQVRWNQASSSPSPQLSKIKVTDVRQYMPSDTPEVTPQMRDEELRVRRKGAQMRIVW